MINDLIYDKYDLGVKNVALIIFYLRILHFFV